MQLSMTFLGFVAVALPLFQVVQGAPAAAALDAATLQQNGQNAQTMNAQFQSLSAKDSCTSKSRSHLV